MKTFRKSLCWLLTVLFILGSLGAASVSAAAPPSLQVVNYGIRRSSPGDILGPGLGRFTFEAVMPSEVLFNASYLWTVTIALPIDYAGTEYPQYAELNMPVTCDYGLPDYPYGDGITYYDTGVLAQYTEFNVTLNALSVALSYGKYFVSFQYTASGGNTGYWYAPMFYNVVMPADREALKAIYEKEALFKVDWKYTPESWEVFNAVRTEAGNLLTDYEAIQSDLDAMCFTLQTAMDNLVETGDEIKGTFGSIMAFLMEILSYIFKVKSDKSFSEIFGDIMDKLLKR